MTRSAGLRLCVDVPILLKDSLFGDLHAYGPDAVRFSTRRKAIS